MVTGYINDTPHDTMERMERIEKMEEMTWHTLAHTHSSAHGPFQLTLTEQELPVLCETILRIVPKKRMVVSGTWNDQPVVVKLFHSSRHAKRHYDAEREGIESLLASGIPTPRILFHGPLFKGRAYVLVFEYITDAFNLDDLWQQKSSPEELIPILHAVTIELATQHVLGIMQHDLHFKNFLLKGNQVYTLDGGSIENFHELLPKKTSLEHLALFFSELGVGTEYLQKNLFQVYAQSRGWLVKPNDIRFLHAAIKKWNKKRRENYQKKIQRNCSAFATIQKTTSSGMYDRHYLSPDFQAFLANPESAFAHPQMDVIKAGRGSTVIKINMAHETLVIKRHNIKNPLHWMRRTLRKTRARESWKLANTLRLFGVTTPKPIAFIEKTFLGFKSKSYFVMAHVEGQHLSDYFKNYRPDDAHFEKIAVRVLALFKNIAKLKMSHGDLKATNILIERDQPVLLDLDGMKEHKTQRKANQAYKRDMKRFMKNWNNQPMVKALFERLL